MSRREGGVAEWTYATGRVLTRPTLSCCHCNRVVIIEQGARAEDCGGFCRCCMKPTCSTCADKGCTPFERRLEQYEARYRMLRSMGI